MSIVTVVYVAGTPAHEGLSRDPQQHLSLVLWCVNDFTGEEAALTHHKFHSLLAQGGQSCSPTRGEDSIAQLSSPVIFSSFPDDSLAAELTISIFLFAK